VYAATKSNALNAELLQGGNGIQNATMGIPFPIPQNGLEAIWNHTLRFRGDAVTRFGGQAAVTEGGAYTIIGFEEQLMIKYAEAGLTPAQLMDENILFKFKQSVTKPLTKSKIRVKHGHITLDNVAFVVHLMLLMIHQEMQQMDYVLLMIMICIMVLQTDITGI